MCQKGWAMDQKMLNALKQVADGIAAQFGNNCEVAIYDPSEDNGYSVGIRGGRELDVMW